MVDNDILNEIKEDALKRYIPILKDDSLRLIETILEIKKPESILEVGTAVGYSAINFSKHLKDGGKIVTIELNEETSIEAKENIKKLNLDSVIDVVNSDAYLYMQTLEEKFDVIFIDAAKGQYLKYLEQALRLSKKGSIIIADNVLLRGMVMGGYNEHKHRTAVTRLREYIEKVTSDEGLQSTVLAVGDGVAISVVK